MRKRRKPPPVVPARPWSLGDGLGGSSAQGASNLFSARLTEAAAFDYCGHRYDLRAMLGRGITQMDSAGPAFTPRLKKAKSAHSFVGTAIRIGGNRARE